MSDVRSRSGGFFVVRNDLFAQIMQEVGTTGFGVYCALLRFADRQGECFPSRDRIAADTGLSVETVRRVLRELRDAGFITVEYRFDPDGRQTANLYTIEDMGVIATTQAPKNTPHEAPKNPPHQGGKNVPLTIPSKEQDPEEQDTTDVASPCKRRTASQTSVVPRAADEVREFANDAGLDATEADGFFDYWQSVGWRRGGRSPIKDWHAAYRNWLRQARKFVAGGSQTGGGLAARAEYYNDRIRKDPQLAGLFFGDPGGYALNTG